MQIRCYALPASGSDLPLGFAVRESGLNCFDDVAQVFRQHFKKEYDALLIHRFMAQSKEIRGIAISTPAFRCAYSTGLGGVQEAESSFLRGRAYFATEEWATEAGSMARTSAHSRLPFAKFRKARGTDDQPPNRSASV